MEKEISESVKRQKDIKKYTPYHEKARFNEIYLKGSRPLQVYKRHALKVLTKHSTLILHGMTAAIDKTVQLHLWLMEEFPYLKVDVQTDSVPTIAEVEGNKQIIERSAIHITFTK